MCVGVGCWGPVGEMVKVCQCLVGSERPQAWPRMDGRVGMAIAAGVHSMDEHRDWRGLGFRPADSFGPLQAMAAMACRRDSSVRTCVVSTVSMCVLYRVR